MRPAMSTPRPELAIADLETVYDQLAQAIDTGVTFTY